MSKLLFFGIFYLSIFGLNWNESLKKKKMMEILTVIDATYSSPRREVFKKFTGKAFKLIEEN